MRTNFERTARNEDGLDAVRPIVEHMVRSETSKTGSKMLAYERVGDAIGKSPSWIRKLLGHRDDLALQFFEGLNILRAYEALCVCVERAAAEDRAKAEHLRSLIDAPAQGAAGVVEGSE